MSFVKSITKAVTSPSSLVGGVGGFLTGGPAGAVIGAGLGSYSDYMSTEQQRQQNKLNQQMVDRANQYDLKLWNMNNEYNDPKNQMARLAAAGLNPNLVYGGGNVTGNTSGVAGSNGTSATVAANRVGNAMQLAQMGANIASTRQDIERSKAQEEYTKAQTTNLNNFLNGTGKSTFTRSDNSVSVLGDSPDTAPASPSLADVVVSLAPNTDARKTMRAYVNKSGITDKIANALFPAYDKVASLFYPNIEDQWRNFIFKNYKKGLDNDLKTGKITRARYIHELAL